jgi:hypothetical protein
VFNRGTAEVVTTSEPPSVDPTSLVTLAELSAEGFGHDSLTMRTPRDAVDVLAAQLDGEVVLDDLGQRCASRLTARRLFAERAALEVRQREVQERRDAQFAAGGAQPRLDWSPGRLDS